MADQAPPGVNMPKKRDPRLRQMQAPQQQKFFDSADYETVAHLVARTRHLLRCQMATQFPVPDERLVETPLPANRKRSSFLSATTPKVPSGFSTSGMDGGTGRTAMIA
ncbi:hypothetical protein CGC20_34360 [Leishmania donovani]|uniref:Uncharacterized protein n=1 Tax=Leishmania donovani TaxID=5661 RepID=A0A504XQ35_LEIDO|nr:hypothetical protein CGC21_20605 [Leishmania donovani]TPP47217.1 hypothetical protein CGC20_34360 [Leishmania donovani]